MGAVLQADVRTPTILAILLACRVPMRLTAAPAVLKMAALLDIFLKTTFKVSGSGLKERARSGEGPAPTPSHYVRSFSQRDWGSD
jgi:hypothetical protein